MVLSKWKKEETYDLKILKFPIRVVASSAELASNSITLTDTFDLDCPKNTMFENHSKCRIRRFFNFGIFH